MINLIKRLWTWFHYNWLAPQAWCDEWVEFVKDNKLVYVGLRREMSPELEREYQQHKDAVSARLDAAFKEMDAAFNDPEVQTCRTSSRSRSSSHYSETSHTSHSVSGKR